MYELLAFICDTFVFVNFLGLFFFFLLLFPLQGHSIAGGGQTDLQRHPWQLRLRGCGATLIGARHVLTAAHCLRNVNLDGLGLTGGGDGHRSNLEPLPQAIKVYVHPEYKGWYGTHSSIKRADIAIIELKEDVTFSETLRPAELPGTFFDFESVRQKNPSNISITGWGKFDLPREPNGQLREGKGIEVLPRFDNEFWINKILLLAYDGPHYTYSETFKTGHYLVALAGSTQPCEGDSGGPMVDTESETLIGVSAHVIASKQGCGGGKYFFYTDVGYFMPWIQSVISQSLNKVN